MKVEFSKSIDVEGEVDITAEEIAAAVEELFAEAGRRMEFEQTQRGRAFGVLQFINAAHSCLKAITPEMIADIKPGGRIAIADALRTLAERFHPRLGEAGE